MGGSTAFSFPLYCRGGGEKKSLGNGRLAIVLRADLRMRAPGGLDIMAAAKGSTMSTGQGLYWHPLLKRPLNEPTFKCNANLPGDGPETRWP